MTVTPATLLAWLPRPFRVWMQEAARAPHGGLQRSALRLAGLRARPVPPPALPGNSPLRVYIAPANYAGQGWAWARALDRSGDDITAWNTEVRRPGGFDFPADRTVGLGPFHLSKVWQDAEFSAAARFTHVLVEASRSMFAAKFGYDVATELRALRARGVDTAMIAHGSEVRSPRAHRARTAWSPFDGTTVKEARLQAAADRNAALMIGAGVPLFVSTPGLLHDLPTAHWCPVVVDGALWRAAAGPPGASGQVPLVVHAPTNPWLKGSALIEPVLQRLVAEGVVRYRPLSGVPPVQMPEAVGQADIVLEQFRLGDYGATAIEAMAAGRVVVARVDEQVRRHVREVTGLELPIIEAAPDALGSVLRELAADPERRSRAGRDGRRFAAAVHDGRWSARVLREEWIDRGDGRAPYAGSS